MSLADETAETIRAALYRDPVGIATRLGFRVGRRRRGGRMLFGATCARATHRRRDAVSLDPRTGRWGCLECGRAGGLLDAIAIAFGLHVYRDAGRVLELAAHMVGAAPGADAEVSCG